MNAIRGLCAAVALSWVTGWSAGQPDARALVQRLNAELLVSRSATETLEKWCAEQHLAAQPRVAAHLVKDVERAPDAQQRAHLDVTSSEAVKYRRVQLECGARVLSEADNWYVPARLTPEMNRLLETTDTPFGAVVRPLEPYRRTLTVTMLWSPTAGASEIPDALFAHRAILYTRDHVPFSEVYEVYQRELLASAPPRAR